MRNVLAIARRILVQFAHDRRTLALLFVAPIVVLWLLTVLLGQAEYQPRIAAVDLPSNFETCLLETDATVTVTNMDEAERMLRANEVDAVLHYTGDAGGKLMLWAEGSDSTKTAASMRVVNEAFANMQSGSSAKMDVELTYLHGNSVWKKFDFYGPVFIGIFLFVFVFITSGMSLVNERSAGTMARFLATPVKPTQILGGYTLGFGALALVHSSVIVLIALTLIGFPCEGSIALVVLIAVSLALASVTLGLLVSGLASSAFQVIQLMLLFVVPQILLCGLFDLSYAPGWLQTISACLPLTYGVDALRAIMLRGAGLAQVGLDLAIVWGFIVAFFVLASIGFRKKRAAR